MNHNRFLDLFCEFNDFIVSLHTLYLDSIIGYEALHNAVKIQQNQIVKHLGECEVAEEKFQDQCSISYKELCGEEHHVVSMSPLMKQGEIKNRTKTNGHNWVLIGRQCVVSAYTYWEEYLRLEIAYALEVLNPEEQKEKKEIEKILNKHVSDDFWGDIRHFRNSIVHKNGIANSDVAKCKILKWFTPGEPLNLDQAKMRVIFLSMGRYRNTLHSLSSPPRKGIIIPKHC
jgi:hypothetical protein